MNIKVPFVLYCRLWKFSTFYLSISNRRVLRPIQSGGGAEYEGALGQAMESLLTLMHRML
jgi:hypothetical protein